MCYSLQHYCPSCSCDEQHKTTKMESKELLNILLICCAVFSGGVSVSLLSPFYPKEALAKGVSVTCSGVVIGSVFISTVIFTPIAGKYVMVLGTRNTLVYGFVNVALGNISFGFLDHIQNKIHCIE